MSDGVSGDIPRSNQGNEGNKISRREALKLGALAVGAFAAGEGLRVLTSQKDQTVTAQSSSDQPSATPTEAANVLSPDATKVSTETPVKKETPEDLFKKVVETSPLFRNCSDVEREDALKMVKQQVTHYEGPIEHLKKIMRGDRTKNTLEWKEAIDNYYREIETDLDRRVPKGNPVEVKNLLLSLIFVESGGKKDEVSSAEAKGLCQLRFAAIEGAREFLGNKRLNELKHKDLFDPRTNIQLALVHLSRLLHVFHDPGIALWAYHLGEGNMVQLIDKYCKLRYSRQEYADISAALEGEKVKKLDKVTNPKTGLDDRPGSAKIIDYFGLNYIRLISDSVVNGWLKDNKIGDSTEKYVPRVGAASFFIKDEEIKIAQDSEIKSKRASFLQKHLRRNMDRAA